MKTSLHTLQSLQLALAEGQPLAALMLGWANEIVEDLCTLARVESVLGLSRVETCAGMPPDATAGTAAARASELAPTTHLGVNVQGASGEAAN